MNKISGRAAFLAEEPEMAMEACAAECTVDRIEESDLEVRRIRPVRGPADIDELHRQVNRLRSLTKDTTQESAPFLESYTEQLGCISRAVAEMGYSGLADMCQLFQEGIASLTGHLTSDRQGLLSTWPEQLRLYLNGSDSQAGAALVAHLQDPALGLGITAEDADMLLALLSEEDQEQSISSIAEMQAQLPAPGEISASNDAESLDELFAESMLDTTSEQPPGDPLESEGEALDKPADEELPPGVAELVDILRAELPLMEDPLDRALQLAVSADTDPGARIEVIGIYAGHLDRFGEAAKAIGFTGLLRVCEHTRDNLPTLDEPLTTITPDQATLFREWGRYVQDYLASPGNPRTTDALVDMLRAPDWIRPLDAEAAQELRSQLQSPSLAAVEEEAQPTRLRQACEEDVSLALPEDVNHDLLEAMLQELPGQIEELSNAIQNLGRGGGLSDVKVAQRIAHTLKGTGNTVGVRGLANLAHHLEDILVECAQQETLPAHGLYLSLVNAADCLEGMGETLTGVGSPPGNTQAILQEILDWANRIDEQGLPQGEETLPVHEEPAPQASTLHPTPESNTPVNVSPTARVPVNVIQDLLRLAGETIILTGQVHERLRGTADQVRNMRNQFQRMQTLGSELEQYIDITDLNPKWQTQAHPEFDSLEMDRYSELHTMSRMLVELATDAHQMGATILEDLGWLDDMLITQEHLNRETQDAVLHTRMVPIKSIVPRLQRSVRQACRATGKQAELHASGADTMLDSDILDRLVDPLMHLLRNAVDHGIESNEQRVESGKGAVGNIQLDIQREGNGILVCCKDDGKGLDYDAIQRAAEERNLLTSGSSGSQDELKRLLLRPNFSTRSEVTQTSGRGIGMDVVYTRILELGGSLNLESEQGNGTQVNLRVPLTLMSTHALLVHAGPRTVAIANRGIEQILSWDEGELHRLGNQIVFRMGDETYPVRRLENMLKIPADRRAKDRDMRPVLLVRDEMGVSAVLVQDVIENRNLVVKNLGCYLPKLSGMVGATILGDGAVVPVLDLPELLRGARQRDEPAAADTERRPQQASDLPSVLVVDDSLSARRSLAQIMEDSGYQVRTARDGMEAAVLIDGKRPDVVLADMEMPRMNGIELTGHLRANPETEDLPVIMITSRSARKHQEQAELAGVNAYLTKPFSEDELLDQVEKLRRVG